MKQIIIFPQRMLDEEAKRRLSNAGYVVIEHENPESVRVIPNFGISNKIVASSIRKMDSIFREKFLDELADEIEGQ